MTEQQVVRSGSTVDQALHRGDLVPPDPGSALGDGAMAKLRCEMARFSSGPDHTSRRKAVESAIARIDLEVLARLAAEETTAAMADGRISVDELAAAVPTRAVARSLGADLEEQLAIQGAVEAVAEAIGRGRTVETTADRHCLWLLGRFADHPDGAVAAVSVLYQNRDATAALLIASADNSQTSSGDARKPAVSGTVRQATEDLVIGPVQLAAGEQVRLEFTTAQEFGAGPHRCPGEQMARCLVDAIIAAAARG